jgi:DNA-binding winged helix-turn-helix (wHTH) protein
MFRQLLFGKFRLDRENALLLRNGEPVPMTPKALDVLHYLASHQDMLVTKNDLLSTIWPDVVVGDASIKVCVREIRKTLLDDADSPQFIQTVHRRGYRFIAKVSKSEEPAADAETAEPARLAAVAQTSGARLLRPAEGHTVGRRQELSTLRSAFDSAAAGHGQVICEGNRNGDAASIT